MLAKACLHPRDQYLIRPKSIKHYLYRHLFDRSEYHQLLLDIIRPNGLYRFQQPLRTAILYLPDRTQGLARRWLHGGLYEACPPFIVGYDQEVCRYQYGRGTTSRGNDLSLAEPNSHIRRSGIARRTEQVYPNLAMSDLAHQRRARLQMGGDACGLCWKDLSLNIMKTF